MAHGDKAADILIAFGQAHNADIVQNNTNITKSRNGLAVDYPGFKDEGRVEPYEGDIAVASQDFPLRLSIPTAGVEGGAETLMASFKGKLREAGYTVNDDTYGTVIAPGIFAKRLPQTRLRAEKLIFEIYRPPEEEHALNA